MKTNHTIKTKKVFHRSKFKRDFKVHGDEILYDISFLLTPGVLELINLNHRCYDKTQIRGRHPHTSHSVTYLKVTTYES